MKLKGKTKISSVSYSTIKLEGEKVPFYQIQEKQYFFFFAFFANFNTKLSYTCNCSSSMCFLQRQLLSIYNQHLTKQCNDYKTHQREIKHLRRKIMNVSKNNI